MVYSGADLDPLIPVIDDWVRAHPGFEIKTDCSELDRRVVRFMVDSGTDSGVATIFLPESPSSHWVDNVIKCLVIGLDGLYDLLTDAPNPGESLALVVDPLAGET